MRTATELPCEYSFKVDGGEDIDAVHDRRVRWSAG
jgi:hypothetical protein